MAMVAGIGRSGIRGVGGTFFTSRRRLTHNENMNEKDTLLSVGFDRKWGGYDFGVRADIVELSPEEMDKFRAMVIAAIGTMEDMWRRERANKNPPSFDNSIAQASQTP